MVWVGTAPTTLPVEARVPESVRKELLARGHPSGTVRAVLGVLDECDRARFAPGGADLSSQEARLERAGRLLGELDKVRRNG